MQSRTKWLFLGALLLVFSWSPAYAEQVPGEVPAEVIDPAAAPLQEFSRGVVRKVVSEEERQVRITNQVSQTLEVELVGGTQAGKTVTVEHQDAGSGTVPKYRVGDKVVIAKVQNAEETYYELIDRYRLPAIWYLLGVFLALVIAFASWQGAGSLLGLVFSLVVILRFMLPQLLEGKDAVWVAFGTACVIAAVSTILAHGWRRRTLAAAAANAVTLGAVALLSQLAVYAVGLSGLGTEEAVYLQLGFGASLSLKGLLLAGLIIGTLGVLDDVTTAQAAAVEEVHTANPTLSSRELYRKGLSVGREHIAALVNTLALVYAGASLPLLVLFSAHNPQPWWVTFNSEFVLEEVVRTLVGSSALILAVPVSTALAVYLFKRGAEAPKPSSPEPHVP